MEKKNFKHIFISVCLALLLASIGGLLAGAESSENPALAISAETLDVNGKIGIAYAVPKSTYENYNGVTGGLWLQVWSADPTVDDSAENLIGEIDAPIMDGNEPKLINNHVVYVTDGFAPLDFSDTIYVRLCSNGEYGPTRKSGVLELTYKMLTALPEENLSTAQTTRKNLYNSIIAYHAQAQKVFLAEYDTYTYVQVNNGLIDGKWQSGMFKAGDVLNVTDSVYEQSIGATLVGWSADGTTLASNSLDSYTVPETDGTVITLEPMFTTVYDADANVLLNSNKDFKGQYANWYNTTEGYTVTSSSNSATAAWKYDENGYYFSSIHDKVASGSTGVERFWYPTPTDFGAGKSAVLTFGVMMPSIDYDGDGANDSDSDISPTGSLGNYKLGIGIANSSTYTHLDTQELFDIRLTPKATSGTVTHFAAQTTVRTSEGDDKNASTAKSLYFDTWYTIQVEFIAGDAYIDTVNVYIDGELASSRTMGSTSSYFSLKNNSADTALALADMQKIGFSIIDSLTMNGEIRVKDMALYSTSSLMSGSDVVASENYGANELIVGAYDSNYNFSLTPYSQLNGFVGYTSNTTASKVLYSQNRILTSTLQSAEQSYAYLLFKNPAYGMSAEELAGKTMTFTYGVTIASSDHNGDGSWSTKTTNDRGTTSSINTKTFIGFLDPADVTTGSNTSTQYINSVFDSDICLKDTNTYRIRTHAAGQTALSDEKCTYIGNQNYDDYITVTVVMTFNADGKVATATITTDATTASATSERILGNTTDVLTDDLGEVIANNYEYFGISSSRALNRYANVVFKDLGITLK